MQEVEFAAVRQGFSRWLHVGQDLVGRLIPEFLGEHERLRTEAHAARKECESLRLQINEVLAASTALRSENERLQARVHAAEQEGEQFREELTALRTENENLRREQEIWETLGRSINDTIRLMNDVIQTLRQPGRGNPS